MLKKLTFALLAITFLVSLFLACALADKPTSPGKSANAPGHNKTPEADYGTRAGDDSTVNKGLQSSDRVNNDDNHSNGPNRANAPSQSANANANCDNNGFDCNPPQDTPTSPPVDNPPEKPPVDNPPIITKPPTVDNPPKA